MSRQLQINVSLEPVIQHDPDSNMYLVYYKEFPEAFAEGRTPDEAENNLIPTLELMWRERPEDLQRKLLDKYINDNHRKGPTVVIN
ncbi:MAG: hypothetical protein EOO10_18995 [Chitinophagaceae bacterium]|nr:MAG: hypothetical protein EOO10_18995 [Chitinophagaceae bacterium]